MKLPKDRPLYADLRTAFVRFPQLLGDLESRSFSGYVQVNGSHRHGIVFFADGEMQGSDGPLDKIVRASSEPGGTIGVYVAPADLMTLVASLAQPEVLHKDLSSEFVDAMKLLEKLARDGHSGYVEFEIAEGEAHGYLFLIGGEPVEAVYASPERFGSGLGMVPVILDDVDARGAAMSVYRAIEEAAEVPAHGLPVGPPAPDTVLAGAKDCDRSRSLDSDEVHSSGTADDRSTTSAANGAEHDHEPGETHPLHELAIMWGAILGSVETIVDGASEPGTFASVLLEVLQERAKDVSFLDPLAGEFKYNNGEVHFRIMPPPEFSDAMGECLGDTIARISFRLRKVDLESTIQRQLEDIVTEYADTLERFGMSRAASSFLAA
jgi:hypothetical protein